MAETGSVTIKISDELIKERLMDLLSEAWRDGHDYGRANVRFPYFESIAADPFRENE